MTKFIMIRHGHSMANSRKEFGGQCDYALSDLGRLQAEKCAEALKNEKIDAVYASDLKRAYDTAVPVAERQELPIVLHKGLREIFAGDWEGKLFDELCVKYEADYTVWRTDIGRARCTGGESVAELSERVLKALSDIAKDNEGKTVCIATHATPIRAVCAAASGLDACEMAKIPWVSNASISVFEYDGGVLRAVEVDNARHLGDLKTNLPANV